MMWMLWLERIGIYGCAHLVQVVVILGILGFCIGYVIPVCLKDIDDMWRELTKEKASLRETDEATEKTTTTSSLSRKA